MPSSENTVNLSLSYISTTLHLSHSISYAAYPSSGYHQTSGRMVYVELPLEPPVSVPTKTTRAMRFGKDQS